MTGAIETQPTATVLACWRPEGHDGCHSDGVSTWGVLND